MESCDEELAFHIAELTDDLLADGLSPPDARHLLLFRRLGGV